MGGRSLLLDAVEKEERTGRGAGMQRVGQIICFIHISSEYIHVGIDIYTDVGGIQGPGGGPPHRIKIK